MEYSVSNETATLIGCYREIEAFEESLYNKINKALPDDKARAARLNYSDHFTKLLSITSHILLENMLTNINECSDKHPII